MKNKNTHKKLKKMRKNKRNKNKDNKFRVYLLAGDMNGAAAQQL